ncbi:lysine-2,3-aminomutase-like protein [Rhizobium sp. L1K21]|uniref:lysine-2,3-aminomutase-like protein n=1 Tax=Rhizobium sp. L1K21 TaxID=2954933 RepID=UPI00209301EA|nr:lysine-2,3-aminomutase-like protein [Rhizobium sp. L1K21]MCO6184966.1 lysine-2,3-aminomutase-like protein [Rhizobium sp. L1K21]
MTATLTTIEALIRAGHAQEDERDALSAVAERYAVAVTPHMQALIRQRNDPIARQFIPDPQELQTSPPEDADPIGDRAHTPVEGIVHRYPDRVLLKAVHVCPVYCRFCFRREMVGPTGDGLLANEKLNAALDYIRKHDEIWEVIFTGGDPLVLSPGRLRAILEPIRAIPHVKILRFHTRVPLVDPERVTAALVDVLKESGKTIYIALHANHADEFSNAGRDACARLIDSGISMISQSVLLRGINDNVQTLADLMRTFVENRIKPYYLHHPDLAPGTGHFRVSVEEGQELMRQLRGRLSGLCQPTYMLDIPGGHGKAVLNPAEYAFADGQLTLRDFNGKPHRYPPPISASESGTGSRKE